VAGEQLFLIERNYNMRILFLLALCVLGSTCISNAQQLRSYTASEILQQLNKLKVCGSVLYIAAHPDDENTRLLACLANEKLYRTGYLSLTRGDGGQNLVGTEQGVDLGLIRTQELLAARRIDGAEQFFTRAFDFGFSKNPEETFRFWDKEKVLGDVVWVIRKFQPDVIIARFPEDGRAGHGHHSASGILAREAFAAAADEKRFPEQFQYGVKPWQAKRMLWNTFNFGGGNTQSEDQFKMDVGLYNPLMGKSYGELAAESRSQHKSQGFGVPSNRGSQTEYFATISGDKPVADLMDGVDVSWGRNMTGGVYINKASPEIESVPAFIDSVIKTFSPSAPQKSITALLALYSKIENCRNLYWKEQKLQEIKNIIGLCAGLYYEASTAEPYAVPGDSLKINLSVNARSRPGVKLLSVHYGAFKLMQDVTLTQNKNFSQVSGILLPPNQPFSQPYWLKEEMGKAMFTLNKQNQVGMADGPYEMVDFVFEIEGRLLVFQRPLQYKHTDPVKGEIFSPLYIVPALSVSTQTPVIFNTKARTNQFDVTVTASRAVTIGDADAYIYSRSACDTVYNEGKIKGEFLKGIPRNFEYRNYGWDLPACKNQVAPAVSVDGRSYGDQLVTIQYDHIPTISYTRRPSIKFMYQRINLSKKEVGYIAGAGDKIPEALLQMDYKVTVLQAKDITPENLKKFSAIITGIRAYNTNEWMSSVYAPLMQYVKDGGNLVVQYNTSNQIGPVKAKIAPYPFTISRNRVTDENAAVTFLQPQHPVLNTPNKIEPADFNGWVQERSVYEATQADSAYIKIFSMTDPGEKAGEGSLIIAPYGKGNFAYCSLVLFRELPAGILGAYKLLCNLVELPKNK
jgi:LmbE family N-acetylglucosaminyl deacetylase